MKKQADAGAEGSALHQTEVQEPRNPTERITRNLFLQMRVSSSDQRLEHEVLMPRSTDQVAFAYLGDMMLQFVFDQPDRPALAMAHAADLDRLGLTPGRAMAYALMNFRRMGAPSVMPLGSGVYALQRAQSAYTAMTMLDRLFWKGLQEKFPQGILAAVPSKNMLLFAAANDVAAELELVRNAARIWQSSGANALSRLTYRLNADGWQIHAELPIAPPVRKPADASSRRMEDTSSSGEGEVDRVTDAEERLELARQGQRILIFAILASFVLRAVSATQVPLVMLVLLLIALGFYSLLGVVRVCSGLQKSTGATVFCMVLTFVPVAGLISWIVLSYQATRLLRDAGYRVGLLGARA